MAEFDVVVEDSLRVDRVVRLYDLDACVWSINYVLFDPQELTFSFTSSVSAKEASLHPLLLGGSMASDILPPGTENAPITRGTSFPCNGRRCSHEE